MRDFYFSEHVRRTLEIAGEESDNLRHDYMGTEHILLGLTRQTEGGAAVVLKNLNVDPESIRDRIEQAVRRGTATKSRSLAPKERPPELPYTSRGKKVLEYSMEESRTARATSAGTEHLLLGLLREEKGIAAVVLNSLGVTLDKVRTEVHKLSQS